MLSEAAALKKLQLVQLENNIKSPIKQLYDLKRAGIVKRAGITVWRPEELFYTPIGRDPP